MHGCPGREGDLFDLGKKLSHNGINVLIFNFQGSWSSEGTFSFESSMQDVGSALEFLKQNNNIERFNIDTTNIVVSGHSYGGAMALTAALYNPNIKRIISIAGTDESIFGRKIQTEPEFRKWFVQMLKDLEYPDGPLRIDSESFIQYWVKHNDNYDPVRHCSKLVNRDILLIGGWNDQDILLEEHILPLFRRLQELKAESAKIKVFETDHTFLNVREELNETLIDWIKKKK